MAALQVVVGNARAQVVDVVEADVAREPLQDFGQLVVGAAPQRRRREIPLIAAFPMHLLELVLHIKHPDAGPARDRDHHELNQKVGLEAKEQSHRQHQAEDCQVHPVDRLPLPRIDAARGKALKHDKQCDWRNEKQHDGIPHQSIPKPQPARRVEILLHGHGPHVAGAALVEIARARVVDRVFPAPLIIRRERE